MVASDTDFDFDSWLSSHRLETIKETLIENQLTAVADLLLLSEGDVREMVSAIGVRNRLLHAVKLLKKGSGSGSDPTAAVAATAGTRGRQPPGPVQRQPRSASRTATPSTRRRVPSATYSRQAAEPPPPTQPLHTIGGIDIAYIRERKRKEQLRQSERLASQQTERERWITLLQRTVQHPSHGPDDATIQKRKDLQKKEESYRRSLSSSIRKYKQQPPASADNKTPSRRRIVLGNNSTAAANRSVSAGTSRRSATINTNTTGDQSPVEVGSELYENIKTAYSSLNPPNNNVNGEVQASTQRTRVWSRKTVGNQQRVSTPVVPPTPAATIPTPSVPTPSVVSPDRSSSLGRSPSPPPPIGSPSLHNSIPFDSPETTSPHRYPPQQARSPSPLNKTPPVVEPEEPEEHRQRLLSLIEENKQKRIRYWIDPRNSEALR